ncbi:hypothetical protein AgCh_012436 [Apium graveolens]
MNCKFFKLVNLSETSRRGEEARAEKEIIAKYEEWELYRYDPSIKYEPLEQSDVPSFVVSGDFSTDWSDSESHAQDESSTDHQ